MVIQEAFIGNDALLNADIFNNQTYQEHNSSSSVGGLQKYAKSKYIVRKDGQSIKPLYGFTWSIEDNKYVLKFRADQYMIGSSVFPYLSAMGVTSFNGENYYLGQWSSSQDRDRILAVPMSEAKLVDKIPGGGS